MAIYNEILVGRFNRSLQKLFGVKGGPPVPQLAADIQPSHSLFSGAENRYLESWFRYAGRVVLGAGGAGNFSVVRIRNVANSNVIAVIEKILVIGGAGDNPTLRIGIAGTGNQPTLGTAATSSALDPRGQLISSMDMSGKNNSVATGQGTIIMTGAFNAVSVPFEFITDTIHELPLLPTCSYDVESVVANQSITVSMVWRERFLEESERF